MVPSVSHYSKRYKRSILVVICLANLLVPFMGSALNLTLPQIAHDYGMDSISQSWLITAYLLSSAIFQVPMGRLADLWGRRRIFTSGLMLFTVATLGCMLPCGPYSAASLITFRVLQGVGSAMIFATSMAILTTVFDPHERGRAMGMSVAVVYLSLASGPSIGGVIARYWGWQSVFGVTALAGLIACIGAMAVIRHKWAEARGEHFDRKGAWMYGVSLLLFIYGFTTLPTLSGFVMIATGSLLFWAFVCYERRIEQPVLKVDLFFQNRAFTLSSIAALINYAATYPIGFFISLYLQQIKGLPVQHAGLILIVQPVAQALLSPLAGRLSDRIAPHYLASFGMGLIIIGLLSIGFFISVDSPLGFIVGTQAFLGVGFAAFSSPNTNSIMGAVEKRDYTTASATTGTMRLAGQAFSMGITTMMISLFLKREPITSAVSNQFMSALRLSFFIFAVLCALGLYASMARAERKSEG